MDYVTSDNLIAMMNNKNVENNDMAPYLSFYKDGSMSDIIIFNVELPKCCEVMFDSVSYRYIRKKPDTKHIKMYETIINVREEMFSENVSPKYKAFRYAVRKWSDKITISKDVCGLYPRIIEMIETWKSLPSCGKKYGLLVRIGKDKHFFGKYVQSDETMRSKFDVNIFIDKETDCIIGYSVVSTSFQTDEEGIKNYSSIYRKALVGSDCFTSTSRITEYIDYIKLKSLWELVGRPHLLRVNLGAEPKSSGVHKYKQEKFEIYQENPIYNYTKKCTI